MVGDPILIHLPRTARKVEKDIPAKEE